LAVTVFRSLISRTRFRLAHWATIIVSEMDRDAAFCRWRL